MWLVLSAHVPQLATPFKASTLGAARPLTSPYFNTPRHHRWGWAPTLWQEFLQPPAPFAMVSTW